MTDPGEDVLYALDGVPQALALVEQHWELLGPRGVLDRLPDLLRPWGEETLAGLSPRHLEDLSVLACVRGVFGPDDAEELLGVDAMARVAALHDMDLLRVEAPGWLRLVRPLRPYLLERGLPVRVLEGSEEEVLAFLWALRRHSPPAEELLLLVGRAIERFGQTPRLQAQRARLLLVGGRLQEAHKELVEAMERVSTDEERAAVCHDLGAVGTGLADRTLAISGFRSAIAAWTAAGKPVRAAVATGELAMVHMHFGDLQECEERLEDSLAVLEEQDDPYLPAHMLTSRAMLWLVRARPEEALADLAVAEELLSRGHRYGTTYVHSVRGLVALDQGRPQEALASLDRALDQCSGYGFGQLELRARTRRAAALAVLGQQREHRAELRAAKRLLADGDHVAPAILQIVRALGELLDGQTRLALKRVRENAPGAYDHEARFMRALIQRALPDSVGLLRLGNERAWMPDGVEVDLSRYAAAWRILQALSVGWEQGTAVDKAQLFAAGWPGVSIAPSSASARLRQELSRLRKLGLRDALQAHGDGYRLDPDMLVIRD